MRTFILNNCHSVVRTSTKHYRTIIIRTHINRNTITNHVHVAYDTHYVLYNEFIYDLLFVFRVKNPYCKWERFCDVCKTQKKQIKTNT